jgi:hypothetical protein
MVLHSCSDVVLYRCHGGVVRGVAHVQRHGNIKPVSVGVLVVHAGYRFPYVAGGQGQTVGGDHFDPRFKWFCAPHHALPLFLPL